MSAAPAPKEPDIRWRTPEGIHIAADAWGPATGRVVLLLHGGGQTRHAWKGLGASLGDAGYRAVALDARGHGDSDWPDAGDYELDAMVRDLRAVVEAIGPAQPPLLVGASMGGATSLAAIGEGQVRAGALVLVDIVPDVEPAGAMRVVSFMRERPDGFGSLDEAVAAIQAYQPQRRRPVNPVGLAKNLRQRADGRYYWHWDPRLTERRIDLAERRARLERSARRLEVPTLLVRGVLSDMLSDDSVRHFLEVCPRAEYVEVADAAHMVAGDQNDVFAGAVQSFLDRASATGAPGTDDAATGNPGTSEPGTGRAGG